MNRSVLRAGVCPRMLLAGALLVVLSDPVIPWSGIPRSICILLDDSASMGNGTAPLWRRLAGNLSELPGDARLTFIRFAGTALAEFPSRPVADPETGKLLQSLDYPRRLPLDRGATDLAAALELALDLAATDRPAAILLASDLRSTRGEAEPFLQAARDSRIPVYLASPNTPGHPGDGRIMDARHPPHSRYGERFPVVVRLAGPPSVHGSLAWRIDRREQGVTPVVFDARGECVAELTVGPCAPGLCQVNLHLELAGDPLADNDDRTLVVGIPGPMPLLWIGEGAGIEKLFPGEIGRALVHLPSGQLPETAGELHGYGAVVLDDLSLDDLAPQARAALIEAVRHQGLGLMVLGGPHSFGGGGYRHSDLEKILPVVSEGGKARGAASVLFLLDQFGSMGKDAGGASAFVMARQAVLETVKGLWKQDRIGLITFDAAVREVLPLEIHQAAETILDLALKEAPRGGTRLVPALETAIERLSRADTRQRILVLVTDGRFADLESGALEKRMTGESIELVAMAVGAEADTQGLERLAMAGRGRLLRIGNSAELPRWMRKEVERRRGAVERKAGRTEGVVPLPFPIAGENWPTWAAYAVTSAHPEATVYLQSAQGDPLLAERRVGIGRVLALPGGLSEWAGAWSKGPGLGRWLKLLADHASPAQADPGLYFAARSQPGRLEFEIDAMDPETGSWENLPEADIRVITPSGSLLESKAGSSAPGHYQGSVSADLAGVYRLAIRVGTRHLESAVVHRVDEEYDFSGNAESLSRRWRAEGLLAPWSDKELSSLARGSGSLNLGLWLLKITAVFYPLLIIYERVGVDLSIFSRKKNYGRDVNSV